jgi:hypothetical protein
MHADADIIRRLTGAALLRRLPLWLAAALPWLVLRAPLALIAVALFVVVDSFMMVRRIKAQWPRWLDGALPVLEDSSALLVHAESPIAKLQQQRVVERAAQSFTTSAANEIAAARIKRGWAWLALSVLAALGIWGWQQAAAKPTAAPAKALAAATSSELLVSVTPPKYTGVAPFESAPKELQVPQNSRVRWCQKQAGAKAASLELSDGQVLSVGPDCAEWTASESIFWRWKGQRYNLRVVPDQAPQITITAPGELIQVLPTDAKNATIAFTVRDDYQITRATMHMTLARGNGENIRFTDREMPVPATADPKLRSMNRVWSLAELGMEPGDELYFFVRAADNADQPHNAQSPTYTLRLPGKVTEGEETSALPMLVKPENLRSQRQIIIDTEQLLADMKAQPNLPQATIRNRSEIIARDQAVLKRRYGQFLGEESSLFGGEEEEHHDDEGGKMDVVGQYGHKHDQEENATLFDEATKKILRRALTAMWDAEKSLRMISPKTALPPEYKALEAIKELQQADRIYLHKTAFVPPAIKEEKRMSGDVIGTRSYKRVQSDADEPIPPEVRELIETLAAGGPLPALWSREAQDWIRSRIGNDEQRLSAQRAVQDVADGCVPCKPVLRAWLRGAITGTPVLLRAQAVPDTPFNKAWKP